jgi:hypothetical protein
MKNLIPIIILTLLFCITAKAQVNFYDEKTDEEYEISPKTNKKIIKAFLKEQNANAIEFNPNSSPDFPFRLKNKKGNWVLFHIGFESLFMENESKKYSFQFPTSYIEQRGFTFAKHKGKTYLVNLYNEEVETKIGFDEIRPRMVTDTVLTTNIDGEPEEKYIKYLSSFTVKEGNKWGLIELADGGIYVSRNYLYDSPEEVPYATGFQSYQLKMMEDIRKNQNIDLLVALDQNGYYFKGRDKSTQLFGIYMGEGILISKISPKYDQIIRHRNPTIFEVWRNGKVGYYNGNYEAVFEPTFDDFKRVHLDYRKGCAVKRNKKWELYDTNKPEKLVEGNADTIDVLIERWLNR